MEVNGKHWTDENSSSDMKTSHYTFLACSEAEGDINLSPGWVENDKKRKKLYTN